MDGKGDKKFWKIALIILIGLICVGGFILLFVGKTDVVKNIGCITSTFTATVDVSLALTFNFNFNINKTVNNTVDKHVEKIKNEYDIKIKENYKQIVSLKNDYQVKIEENNKQIMSLKNEVNYKNYQINKIENNYNQPAKQFDNPDDDLYNEMKNLYDPIEEFFVDNGGFGVPFRNAPFMDMIFFAESCTLNKYKFINESLKAIHEKLKISTCELANIICIYSYTLESNSGISKFEYLDIMKKITYMPEAYSKSKVEEHEAKFTRANELLKEIVEEYRTLDDKYKELRFK